MNNSSDMSNSVFNTVYKITMEAKETEDDFIFTRLSEFLHDKYQTVIPKKLLLCALEEFRHNHPDIYDCMIQEAQDRSLYGEERLEVEE